MKSVDAGPAGDVERLYRDDGARLWRAILFLSGDSEIANDAVAEAFAQALARGSEIRSLRAWVWKAAFLIANGQLKERRRAPPAAGPDVQQFPDATVELVEALQTLSPRQRSSVILHYYQGYTLRETAQLLGSTVPSVAVHLRRARSKLKDYLEADDG